MTVVTISLVISIIILIAASTAGYTDDTEKRKYLNMLSNLAIGGLFVSILGLALNVDDF